MYYCSFMQSGGGGFTQSRGKGLLAKKVSRKDAETQIKFYGKALRREERFSRSDAVTQRGIFRRSADAWSRVSRKEAKTQDSKGRLSNPDLHTGIQNF